MSTSTAAGLTMILLRTWLLARHPQHDDAEAEGIAEAMMVRVGPLPLHTPLLPLLQGIYEEVTG